MLKEEEPALQSGSGELWNPPSNPRAYGCVTRHLLTPVFSPAEEGEIEEV